MPSPPAGYVAVDVRRAGAPEETSTRSIATYNGKHVEGPMAAYLFNVLKASSEWPNAGLLVSSVTNDVLSFFVQSEYWHEARPRLIDIAAQTGVELTLPD